VLAQIGREPIGTRSASKRQNTGRALSILRYFGTLRLLSCSSHPWKLPLAGPAFGSPNPLRADLSGLLALGPLATLLTHPLSVQSLRSTADPPLSPSPPNTRAARSRSWLHHSPIWFGWTSNSWANSARVFSPRRAARVTLALKLGEWLRRDRLLIVGSSLSALPTPSGGSLST
jgi:hypothetical protein